MVQVADFEPKLFQSKKEPETGTDINCTALPRIATGGFGCFVTHIFCGNNFLSELQFPSPMKNRHYELRSTLHYLGLRDFSSFLSPMSSAKFEQ